MKKLVLTIAIVLGMGIAASAQGGLFKYGDESDYEIERDGIFKGGFGPNVPIHDQPGNGDAPLTGGALLLIGFGAAYALKKRNEK